MENFITQNGKYTKELLENGFRIGDQIEISPLSGKKKSFSILYNRFELSSDQKLSERSHPGIIYIPSLSGDYFHLILEKKEKERFLLSSKGDLNPFFINGQSVLSCWIMRGDKVEICHNIITFKENKKTTDHSFWSHFIPQEKILKSEINILIEGETGTGKTTLARKIHELSGRTGNFVHLNLEAYPEGLLESELFGHTKGAFTGAIQSKIGALALADKGTLFLDEIDSLSPAIQCKLLLFLDKKSFSPLGSCADKKSDTRFIFATSSPLKGLILDKKIRKDFYYRIASGEHIKILPLRSSPHMVEQICSDLEKEYKISFSSELLNFYKTLPWPGNIRQIKQHVYKKSIISKNKKLIYEKEDEQLLDDSAIPYLQDEYHDMKSYQYLIAQKIFQRLGGHLKKSAQILDLSPSTLRNILKMPPPMLRIKMGSELGLN